MPTPTLGQLIVKDQLGSNTVFTHFSNYFFKGLPKVSQALDRGKAAPMAEAYAKLDDLRPGLKVTFQFHHEHLTSNSSWVELSGQKQVLILGITKNVTDAEIQVVPTMIA